MKKMFVLFLIVALLPFTTGCGIFGDNDDATGLAAMGSAVDFSVNSELAGSISGNLRASAQVYTMDEIRAMTITIGDVVMSFGELISSNPIKIKFSAKVSTIKLQQLVETNEPVAMTIKNNKGEEVKKFEVVLPQEIVTAGAEAAPEITIASTGEIEIKVTPTSTVKPVASVETTGGVTITELSAPTIQWQSGMGGTPAAFTNGMTISFPQPVFLITLKNGSSALNLTNNSCSFSLKVTKANSETVAEYAKKVVAGGSYDEPNQKFALMVSDATNGVLLAELQSDLTPGTYTVSIPQIVFTAGNGNMFRLKGLTYSFKIQ
ncbi:MAG: hypothetical protein M0R31_10780 [Candidatus Riflebacteria bacterium]|nr:hypothetical protein [Candidatus Riflebacteria bacterium]